MFLLGLIGDAVASALGGLFPERRRGRPPREPWAVRRSRKRMEAQRRKANEKGDVIAAGTVAFIAYRFARFLRAIRQPDAAS